MKRATGMVMGLAAGTLLSIGAAGAQGLDFLHSQRVEGGRVCMSDHFHSGSSSGHANRQAAERAAISGWASFTGIEYGNAWASWRIAGSKTMNCSQAGGGWGCELQARPCRLNVGGRRRR